MSSPYNPPDSTPLIVSTETSDHPTDGMSKSSLLRPDSPVWSSGLQLQLEIEQNTVSTTGTVSNDSQSVMTLGVFAHVSTTLNSPTYTLPDQVSNTHRSCDLPHQSSTESIISLPSPSILISVIDHHVFSDHITSSNQLVNEQNSLTTIAWINIEPTPSLINTNIHNSSVGTGENNSKRTQNYTTTSGSLQFSSEFQTVDTIVWEDFNGRSTSMSHLDESNHFSSVMHQPDIQTTQPLLSIQPTPSLKYYTMIDVPTSPLTLPFSDTKLETWSVMKSQLDLEVTSLESASSMVLPPGDISTHPPSSKGTSHGKDKKADWAVPVVVTLSIVVVFLLLIIVMMFLRTRQRQLSNGYPDEDDIRESFRHEHTYNHRHQHQQQRPHQRKYLTPPRTSVTTFPSSGEKFNSLPSNTSSSRLNAGAGLPKNFSGELYKKSSFDDASLHERIELENLSGIDTTDGDLKQLQAESRLYDYGYGASNIQNFEKRFHKYIRENSNKNPSLVQIHSSFPVSGAPNGGRTVVRETGIRSSAQHDLIHVEDESRDASHPTDLTTYPPAKPRRSIQPNANGFREELDGTSYANKGYVPENDDGMRQGRGKLDQQEYSNGYANGDANGDSNGDANVDANGDANGDANDYDIESDTSTHGTEDDAETLSDFQSKRSKVALLGDRRHVISKCVSFDATQLKDFRGKPRVPNATSLPVRKVSTVSEPSPEYLTVTEEKRLIGSNSIYETVDNLSQVDSEAAHVSRFFIGSFAEEDRVDIRGTKNHLVTRSVKSSHPSRGNAENLLNNSDRISAQGASAKDEREQSGATSSKSKSAFVFPSVSQASKKILEGRNSKKLKPRSSTDGGQKNSVEKTIGCFLNTEENPSFSTTSGKNFPSNGGGRDSDHVGISGGTRHIPKIVLTKDAGELEKEDLHPPTSTLSDLNPPKTRRIARANNPFLIEVDRLAEQSPTDKVRRSSAPSMASNLDMGGNVSARHGMTRSVSGELLGMSARAAAGYSDINPYTARSWSTEFQNLITSSTADDPNSEKRLKQMIDERYNVLFGNKYPEINRMEMRASPTISPRIVKRRHAAKVKAASLERDGDYTHTMLAHQEEPETDGSTDSADALVYGYDDIMQVLGEKTNSQLAGDKSPHAEIEEPVCQAVGLSSGPRPSLQQGMDGCDVERSTVDNSPTEKGHLGVGNGTISPENEFRPNRTDNNAWSNNGDSLRKIPLGKTNWARVDAEINTSVHWGGPQKLDGSQALNTPPNDRLTYVGSTLDSSSVRNHGTTGHEKKFNFQVKVSGQSLNPSEMDVDETSTSSPVKPRRTYQFQAPDESRGRYSSKLKEVGVEYLGEDPNALSQNQRRCDPRGDMDVTLTSRHIAVPRYMGARPSQDAPTDKITFHGPDLWNYLENDSDNSAGKDVNLPPPVYEYRPTPKARQIKLTETTAHLESASSYHHSDKVEGQISSSSSTSSYSDDEFYSRTDIVMEDGYLDSLQSSTV